MTTLEQVKPSTRQRVDDFLERFESVRLAWTMPAPKDSNVDCVRMYDVTDSRMKRPWQQLLFIIYKTDGWAVLVDPVHSNAIDATEKAILEIE